MWLVLRISSPFKIGSYRVDSHREERTILACLLAVRAGKRREIRDHCRCRSVNLKTLKPTRGVSAVSAEELPDLLRDSRHEDLDTGVKWEIKTNRCEEDVEESIVNVAGKTDVRGGPWFSY